MIAALHTKRFLLLILLLLCISKQFAMPVSPMLHQQAKKKSNKKVKAGTFLYGTASYYAEKFNGKKTASGKIFDQKKFTAACNVLPLGTWIRVTNLKNFKTVVLQTNDRLSKGSSRIVDLTVAAAKKIGFYKEGLTRVKVEVLTGNPNK